MHNNHNHHPPNHHHLHHHHHHHHHHNHNHWLSTPNTAPDGTKKGGKGRGRKSGGDAASASAAASGDRAATGGGLFATDAPSNAWVEIDYSRQLLDSGSYTHSRHFYHPIHPLLSPLPLITITLSPQTSISQYFVLLRSGDLLFENAKEDKFRGCMVMHINKDHKIHRLDYHWKEHD